MKILLINGSPHENGVTAAALSQMEKTITAAGLDTERIWLGKGAVMSCLACGLCRRDGRCFYEDVVNRTADACRRADGLIIGTPVHYAGASGILKSVLGRLFMSAGRDLRQKPAIAVALSRRGGNVCALEEIDRFFKFNEMPSVSGNYWCIAHGSDPEKLAEDREGLQTLSVAAENLCWLVKAIGYAAANGILPPPIREKIRTDFIR